MGRKFLKNKMFKCLSKGFTAILDFFPFQNNKISNPQSSIFPGTIRSYFSFAETGLLVLTVLQKSVSAKEGGTLFKTYRKY